MQGYFHGGRGWIRTIEAYATDLQSAPFGHSGTRPYSAGRSRLDYIITEPVLLSTLFRKNFDVFFHHIILQDNPMPDDLLGLDHLIPAVGEKRPGGNGRLGEDPRKIPRRLQPVTEGGPNPLPLQIPPDIQPVEVPVRSDIAEPGQRFPVESEEGGVFRQRSFPSWPDRPSRPRLQSAQGYNLSHRPAGQSPERVSPFRAGRRGCRGGW